MLVRLHGVLELVFLIPPNLDLAAADHVEQVLGGGDEVLALGDVVVERRAGREQRTLGLQDVDVESFNLPRGAAEAREHAERANAVERSRERGLADAVIYHVAELAAGDL